MEISPRLYHWLVRPNWYVSRFNNSKLRKLLAKYDFSGKSVLDFGCGIGSNCSFFDPKGYLGIDCCDKRIKYARRRYQGYKFRVTDGPRIPMRSNHSDYVFIMAVLHHIPTAELVECFQELARVIKPTGKMIVVEPCLIPNKAITGWVMQYIDRGKYIRSIEDYEELLKAGEFETETRQFFTKGNYNEVLLVASPKQ